MMYKTQEANKISKSQEDEHNNKHTNDTTIRSMIFHIIRTTRSVKDIFQQTLLHQTPQARHVARHVIGRLGTATAAATTTTTRRHLVAILDEKCTSFCDIVGWLVLVFRQVLPLLELDVYLCCPIRFVSVSRLLLARGLLS